MSLEIKSHVLVSRKSLQNKQGALSTDHIERSAQTSDRMTLIKRQISLRATQSDDDITVGLSSAVEVNGAAQKLEDDLRKGAETIQDASRAAQRPWWRTGRFLFPLGLLGEFFRSKLSQHKHHSSIYSWNIAWIYLCRTRGSSRHSYTSICHDVRPGRQCASAPRLGLLSCRSRMETNTQ